VNDGEKKRIGRNRDLKDDSGEGAEEVKRSFYCLRECAFLSS
jgi:hypothetical protein